MPELAPSRVPPFKDKMQVQAFVEAVVKRALANKDITKGPFVYSVRVLSPHNFRISPSDFADAAVIRRTTVPEGALDYRQIERLSEVVLREVLTRFGKVAEEVEVKYCDEAGGSWERVRIVLT